MHTMRKDLSEPQYALVNRMIHCLESMIDVTNRYDVGQDFDEQNELRHSYQTAIDHLVASRWKSASNLIEQLTSRISTSWDNPVGRRTLEEYEDELDDLLVDYYEEFELESDG